MEITNKTFELQLDDTPVKGIITSLSEDELEGIKNLQTNEYSEAVFKVLVLTVPELGAQYFETTTPKVYIVGYEGREGQLGSIENDEFIPYEGDDIVTRKIALNILEVLMLNGTTGHFISK